MNASTRTAPGTTNVCHSQRLLVVGTMSAHRPLANAGEGPPDSPPFEGGSSSNNTDVAHQLASMMKGRPRSWQQKLQAKRWAAAYMGAGVLATALALATPGTFPWIQEAGRRSALETRAQKVESTASVLIRASDDDEHTRTSNTTTVTLVCELRGELGNMLSGLAYCAGLASWVETKHGIRTGIVPRHNGKDGARWRRSLEGSAPAFPTWPQWTSSEPGPSRSRTSVASRRRIRQGTGFLYQTSALPPLPW